MNNCIQLQLNSILHFPFQSYEQSFTFIINNEEFHTSFVVADLLSPKISKFHLVDPTISEYRVNTKARGDFNKIIKLVNFENTEITEQELPFFIEIIENFENTAKTIKINRMNTINKQQKLSREKTLELLKEHQKYPVFYSEDISHEIDQISIEFYLLNEEEKKSIESLNIDIIERIINNSKLQLNNEDELVEMINNFVSKRSRIFRIVFVCFIQ